MSAVLIESHEVIDGTHYMNLSSGKKSAFVSSGETLGVRVTCKNASHSVWRGAGRGFDSFADAIDGYKSADMKAMIECARVEIEGEAEPEPSVDIYGNVRRTDEEAVKIRKIRGVTAEMIDTYEPANAVYKVGKRDWSLKSVMGVSHPNILKTKREAIEFAEKHHRQMATVYADHSGYHDLVSMEAGKRLELMEEFRNNNRHLTEMEAWKHADRLLAEFYENTPGG